MPSRLCGRRGLAGTALVVLVALLVPTARAAPATALGVAPTRGGDTKSEARIRAIQTYAAMQALFFKPDVQLYAETSPPVPGANPYSYHWPFSQAMAATADLSGLVSPRYHLDLAQRARGAERYWDPDAPVPAHDSYVRPPLGQGGDKFYDDNDWTGLVLTQAHRLAFRPDLLARARKTFDFAVSGWDTDPTHPAPGGVFWVDAEWNRDRNTISTAPAAELGLLLAKLTPDRKAKRYYLSWAQRMYDWVNAHMLAENGLFWDHIDLQGRIDKTQWTYNQGTMIGANVLFHSVTGEAEYLRRAERIAAAARARFTIPVLDSQPPAFHAIYFRNLALLAAVTDDPSLLAPLHAWADHAWKNKRDPATGTFTYSTPASLLDQAAMVQVYALDSARSPDRISRVVWGMDGG